MSGMDKEHSKHLSPPSVVVTGAIKCFISVIPLEVEPTSLAHIIVYP